MHLIVLCVFVCVYIYMCVFCLFVFCIKRLGIFCVQLVVFRCNAVFLKLGSREHRLGFREK